MNQYNDIGRWSKWGLWGALEHVTQDPLARAEIPRPARRDRGASRIWVKMASSRVAML